MRILARGFPQTGRAASLNIHPSLLPAFKGMRAHQQAIDAGVAGTGCTVHFVVPEIDAGPIIAQAAVPVLAGDTRRDAGGAHPAGGAPALSAGCAGSPRAASRQTDARVEKAGCRPALPCSFPTHASPK